MGRHPLRHYWSVLGGVAMLMGAWGCATSPAYLPAPVQQWGQRAEFAVPPPPELPRPAGAVVLSDRETMALEELRRRGASIVVFAGSGETVVDFPLGALERESRRAGVEPLACGMGIAHALTPDDSGPEMTDADLRYLEELPRLTRVNLGGTRVSSEALRMFGRAHPRVEVAPE